MAELFLVILFIYLLVKNPTSTLLWAGGIIAFIAVAAVLEKKFGKGRTGLRGNTERPRTRVYHPHVISDDEYECGVCGRRFSRDLTACPYCGVRFNHTETDEEEFIEVEDELESWDEEDGW